MQQTTKTIPTFIFSGKSYASEICDSPIVHRRLLILAVFLKFFPLWVCQRIYSINRWQFRLRIKIRVELVAPPFGHSDPLVPVACPVIGFANLVIADMGKFRLDGVLLPETAFVEER